MEIAECRNRLIRFFIKWGIGFIIGGIVCACLMELGDPEDVDVVSVTIIFFFCAGFPCGWCIIPYYTLGIFSTLIKFVIALCIGWAVTPIELIVCIVRMVSSVKRQKAALRDQTENET